jgi:hypothetical protein
MGKNLETQSANQPVEKKVQSVSDQLNQAALNNNHGAYDNCMREITEMRSKVAPSAQGQFDKAVTGSLMFETVGLYDLKRNFGAIDADSNGKLMPEELKKYADKGNPLQKAFINDHVLKGDNYETIANASSDRALSWFMDDKHIRLADLNKGIGDSQAMRHFYTRPSADKPSLYERFRNESGDIDGINEALDDRVKHNLSDADVRSLEHIQKNRSNWSFIPGKNDMNAEDLKYLSEPSGATIGQEAAPVPNEAMKHFYKKDGNSGSLYERFRKEDGSLDGINEAIADPTKLGLTEKDLASLKFLQEKRTAGSYFNRFNDMSKEHLETLPGPNGLTKAETDRAADILKNNAAASLPPLKLVEGNQPQKPMEIGSQRPGALPVDASALREVFNPEVAQGKPAAKEAMPSAQLMDLASVRKGEGFWQSADRILKADGKPHSHLERKELTDALRAIYNEEKNVRAADMRVRHQLVSKANFQKLIDKVQSDSVKQALMKLAAQ